MPVGYMSFDNIAVAPTPPGVFATSMPRALTSENYIPVSKISLPSTSIMNCSILPQSLSPSTCSFEFSSPSTKAADCLTTRKNESHSHEDQEKKPIDKNKLVQHKIKKEEEISRHEKVRSSPFNTENRCASSGNKPLKVTIRRTSETHTFGGNNSRKIRKQEINSSSNLGLLDLVSQASPMFQTTEKCPLSIFVPSASMKVETKVDISSKMGCYTMKEDKISDSCIGHQRIAIESCLHKDVSTSTDVITSATVPDARRPCEAGSKIVFEGVVWLETPGMIVINAHWRGRAYLGTLLDSSKSTLGPSCPDKMISALSLVKRRQMWNARNNHRNSSRNYIHKNSIYNNNNSTNASPCCNSTTNGNGSGGAAMTTRAAAAAAAAASERSGSDADGNNGHPLESTFRKRGGALSNTQHRTTAKRKRLRGLKARSDFDIPKSDQIDVSTTISPNSNVQFVSTTTKNRLFRNHAQSRDFQQDQNRNSPQKLETSIYYRQDSDLTKNLRDVREVNENVNFSQSGKIFPASGSISKEISSEHSEKDDFNIKIKLSSNDDTVRRVQQPPFLAMAKLESTTSLSYAEDEDQPPPQLDRGPGTEDELCGNEDRMETDLTEPPAASPAYSDISEDGDSNSSSASKAVNRRPRSPIPIRATEASDYVEDNKLFRNFHKLNAKTTHSNATNNHLLKSESRIITSSAESLSQNLPTSFTITTGTPLSFSQTKIPTLHHAESSVFEKRTNCDYYQNIEHFPSQTPQAIPSCRPVSVKSTSPEKGFSFAVLNVKKDHVSEYAKEYQSMNFNHNVNIQSVQNNLPKKASMLQSLADPYPQDNRQTTTTSTSNGEIIS